MLFPPYESVFSFPLLDQLVVGVVFWTFIWLGVKALDLLFRFDDWVRDKFGWTKWGDSDEPYVSRWDADIAEHQAVMEAAWQRREHAGASPPRDWSHVEIPSIPADDPIYSEGVIITSPITPHAAEPSA